MGHCARTCKERLKNVLTKFQRDKALSVSSFQLLSTKRWESHLPEVHWSTKKILELYPESRHVIYNVFKLCYLAWVAPTCASTRQYCQGEANVWLRWSFRKSSWYHELQAIQCRFHNCYIKIICLYGIQSMAIDILISHQNVESARTWFSNSGLSISYYGERPWMGNENNSHNSE